MFGMVELFDPVWRANNALLMRDPTPRDSGGHLENSTCKN